MFPRQTIQYHGNPSYALISNTEEAEVEQFYEDLKDLLENTPKKCHFHYRRLECQSRSQETPGVTHKFGLGIQNEAGQRLIVFCQKNTLVIANTLFQQHKRRLYTWTSLDGRHLNQIDYILCIQNGEALYSQQKQTKNKTNKQTKKQGADGGSDHKHLIAKFRLKIEESRENH